MAAHRSPAFRGRSGERERLEPLLENVRGGQSAVLVIRGEAGRRQDGAAAVLRSRRRPGFASRGSRASSPRWSCRSPGCISSARRCSERLDALPEPQQGALRVALGPRVRRCARPLPGRAGRAQPAGRGGRGAAAAVRRRRRAVARRRLGARSSGSSRDGCWRSRWRSCSRCASRPRSASSPACRSCALDGLADEDARALLATVDPGPARRARPRPDRRRDARQPARAAGAPARALGRAAGRRVRAAGAAAAVGPDRGELPAAARGAAATRRSCCSWSRRPSPLGDPALMWRAATRLGVAGDRARARGAGRAAGGRRAGALPPSAGALGGLPVGVRRRAPARAPGPGGRDRCASSSRIAAPGTARRPRAVPTRTSRPSSSGRRAGRRPAAGSPRRPRSWGARPTLTVDPARRAERMLAAAQANLQAGAFDAALGLLASAAGRAAGRARARARGPAARRGRVRAEPRRRRSAAAAARARARSSRSTRGSRATPISTRGARRCSPGGWRATGRLLDVSRAVATAPRPPRTRRGRATCCSTASRWSSPRGAPPRRRCCSARPTAFAGSEVSVEEVLRWGWLATAAAVYRVGLRHLSRGRRPAASSSPATPGALEVLAVSVNVLGQAVALGGDFATRGAADRRGRRGQGGHGHPRRSVRRAGARGAPRPGGRGAPS